MGAHRYVILAPQSIPAGFMDGRKACELLIGALQLESTEYRLGNSKVCYIEGESCMSHFRFDIDRLQVKSTTKQRYIAPFPSLPRYSSVPGCWVGWRTWGISV